MPAPQLHIAHRATAPGDFVHLSADHVVRVHVSAPVRVLCHGGRREHRRVRGQIDVMPAGMREAWTERDRGAVIDMIVPVALVDAVAGRIAVSGAISPRFHVHDAQIEQLAWSLDAERRDGFPTGPLYWEGLALALIGRLLAAPPVHAPAGGLSAAQRDRVLALIDAELAGPLSVAELARVSGVSGSHFKVLFKRTLGIAPHAYVVRRRVERARALICRGELSISEVAFEVGFAHPSHMARWMRRLLGVTPTALRPGPITRPA